MLRRKKAYSLDIIIKIATPLLSLLAVIIGVGQFNSNQRAMKELELKKIYTSDSLKIEETIWEKKIEVYSKIAKSVGQVLAHDTIDAGFLRDADIFKHIYYGQAIMIEDSSISNSMFIFLRAINNYESGDENTDKETFREIGMTLVDRLKFEILRKKSVYR